MSAACSNEASLHSIVDSTTVIVSSPPVVELPTSNGSSSGDVVQVVPCIEVCKSFNVVATTVSASHPSALCLC